MVLVATFRTYVSVLWVVPIKVMGQSRRTRNGIQRESYALTITCDLLQVQLITDPVDEIIDSLPELSPDLLP